MTVRHSIKPFPADIDRNYFGAWLSGFTDGEECFRLIIGSYRSPGNKEVKKPKPFAEFCISQRSDDVAVLEKIRSFFGCGTIYIDSRHYTKFVSAPKAIYRVGGIKELANIVVPHFDKFPLIAKKRTDFQIWKEGVDLLARISSRPFKTASINDNGLKGRMRKWSEDEMKAIASLEKRLKDNRVFHAVENGSANATEPMTAE